jgi:CelD/BcsL family acetyltransferase involved in cellulose biosynthesis/glycosyltransferase involved in cell wall biosynthesis
MEQPLRVRTLLAPMLTILSVAYPFAPVGPDAVGGAEQIVTALDARLVERGLASVVVACEGSRVRGELVATPAPPRIVDERTRAEVHAEVRRAIAEALRRHPVDVIHLHGVDFDAYLPALDGAGPAILVTLHLPPSFYAPGALARRAGVRYVCVSRSQRATCPIVDAVVVPNGIDLARFRPRGLVGRYALALGRVCPEKGFHLALDAARVAGVPLLLAGQVFGYDSHRRYFAREIVPRLGRDRRFLGPVGLPRKRRLLAGARCVVIPSEVPETSSLVAMEALASATPVVAAPVGALPEIVEHGHTGLLARGVAELAEALRAVGGAIDRRTCRRAAEARFDEAAMIDRYVGLYEDAAGRSARGRHVAPPLTVETRATLAGIEALAVEWAGLWERDDAATPFQHPAWLLPWYRAFQPRAATMLVARRGARAVGLLPLFRFDDEAGRRVVSLAGAGVSDYRDAIVDSGDDERAIAGALVGALAAQPWDVADFGELRAGSLLLETPLPLGLAATVSDGERCPIVPLRPGGAPLVGVPAGQQERLADARRRTARAGLRVEAARAGTVDELMEALFRLHEARWQRRGEVGVLGAPEVQRFHREAARALWAAGLLRLIGLRDGDGRWVAVVHGMAARGRAYAYISGFDPALDKLSPGLVVVGALVESVEREGATELDFLRGREAHKYRWGAIDRPLFRRWIERTAVPAAAEQGSG